MMSLDRVERTADSDAAFYRRDRKSAPFRFRRKRILSDTHHIVAETQPDIAVGRHALENQGKDVDLPGGEAANQ